jgi:uncharacterized Zn finger protein
MIQSERVAAACPSCSPGGQTVHEVLSPGGRATVRCTACGHVHKTTIEEPTTEAIDVVVSQDGESFTAREEVPVEDTLAVGEEFVLDAEEALMTVRITSLQVGDERRGEEATAEDVVTIWTRAVDNVAVNVTVHPGDGNRDDSHNEKLQVPGDHEFVVGEAVEFDDEHFTVQGVHVEDDAAGYDHEKLDGDGDAVLAKDAKRVYGRDETSDAWSAWYP